LIIWGVVAAVLIAAGIWIFTRVGEKPVISVDYVAKFNEARRPANYRAEDDGWQLLSEALAKTSRLPDVLRNPTWMNTACDELVMEARAQVEENKEAIALYEEALMKPYICIKMESPDSSVGKSVEPQLHMCISLACLLMLRGELRAVQGDTSGALNDAAAGGRLATVLGKCPRVPTWHASRVIEERWCRAALQILARGKPTAQDLSAIAGEMSTLPDMNDVLDESQRAERYLLGDVMQRWFTDDGNGDGRFIGSHRDLMGQAQGFGGEVADTWARIRQPGRSKTARTYETAQAKARELAQMEPWQMRQKGIRPAEAISKTIKGNAFLGYMRNWQEMVPIYQENKVIRTGAQATVAVLRYEMNVGVLPGVWEDVVRAGYLNAVPIDGYSGEPLVYRKTEAGFTVYSVGYGGGDEEGDSDRDIVFWPVEKSRSPRY